MDDSTTRKMANFYQACVAKGYTDMSDDNQCLKAKVIATDMELKYSKNMSEFLAQAKSCYETVKAQDDAAAERREAEQRRLAVPGVLILELSDQMTDQNRAKETRIQVYRRPDKSVYCTINDGKKIESAPTISVMNGGTLLYQYHPSKTVYTGATVGGITTGGFHETKASYSEHVNNSGKGYLQATVGAEKITVQRAILPKATCTAFKRSPEIYLVQDGVIYCHDPSKVSLSQSLVHSAASRGTSGANLYNAMNMMNMAADNLRLPVSTCRTISGLLGDIIHGNEPESDEDAYQRALRLMEGNSSAQIKDSLKLFDTLKGYKDSDEMRRKAQNRYDEVLQAEKEAAILEKERKEAAAEAMRKKVLKITAIAVPIVAVCIVVAVIITQVVIPNNNYKAAEALLESGQFEEAKVAFIALGDYKDSADRILEAENGIAYEEAEALLASGQYDEAKEAFAALGDYEDSATQVENITEYQEQEWRESEYNTAVTSMENGKFNDAFSAFDALGDYKDSAEKCNELKQILYDEAVDLMQDSKYNSAIETFEQLGDYKDSEELMYETKYQYALSMMKTSLRNAVNLLNTFPQEYAEQANTIEYQYQAYISYIGDYKLSGEGIELDIISDFSVGDDGISWKGAAKLTREGLFVGETNLLGRSMPINDSGNAFLEVQGDGWTCDITTTFNSDGSIGITAAFLNERTDSFTCVKQS